MSLQKQNYDYLILPDGNYRTNFFGDKGIKGLKGDDGSKGDKGQKGLDGTDGTDGTKGQKGAEGGDGTKGQKGDAQSQVFNFVGEVADPADLPLAPFSGEPEGVDVGLALHGSGELLRNYGAHPRPGEVDEAYARELRHGYRASTSYVDAQVGRVLSALDRTGLAKNTIVVVWGDHGWHLGDHGVWGKHTLFERSLHSPLILRTPEMPSPGVPTRTVVESVDVLPTLLALAGISRPDGLDGRELSPALESPAWSSTDHARSYWRRGPHRGVSVRTDRYRATAWYRDGLPVAHEIYDHELDPNETRNAWDAVPESDLVDLLSRVASSRRFGD